jgi:alkanesulfonate monooxygenase SsuD/methylene tetrahydromethanopterin reductase-like flavin-dependent oxidoreductase (luciferase family)
VHHLTSAVDDEARSRRNPVLHGSAGRKANPPYLARDVADVHRLTNGRLELGLGTGYVEGDFEAAGIPFGTGGEKMRKLESILGALRTLLAAEADQLVQLPGVLVGAPEEIADRLRRYRDEYGVNYISVLEPHLAAFAEVIKHLR